MTGHDAKFYLNIWAQNLFVCLNPTDGRSRSSREDHGNLIIVDSFLKLRREILSKLVVILFTQTYSHKHVQTRSSVVYCYPKPIYSTNNAVRSSNLTPWIEAL